jgi:hypothetical protein
MRWIPRRPSASMVVALLALFVALGGTGYAASKLNGRNIVKNSVSGSALKANTIGGREVNESKLATVPRAKNADRLGGLAASAFLPAGGKAADASLLDGKHSTDFLAAGGKATDADRLDGKDSSDFLAAGAKAADADKLDGADSSAFERGDGRIAHNAAVLNPNETLSATAGLGTVIFTCPANPATDPATVSYGNANGQIAPTWFDIGGTVTLVAVGSLPSDQSVPAAQTHTSIGSMEGTGRSVTAEVYSFGDTNTCDVVIEVSGN